MALQLTLEAAHANIGAVVLQRNTRAAGRPWIPVRLMVVRNDKTAEIRPPGHKRNELAKISDLKLSTKQFGIFEKTAAPYLQIKKKPIVKEAPKFIPKKPKEPKPVIALTQEDIASLPAPTPAPIQMQAPIQMPPPKPTPEPEAAPPTEQPNPREAWRQKQKQEARERFLLVDRADKRFYTTRRIWLPELHMAARYPANSVNRARSKLMGPHGKAQDRSVEVVTIQEAQVLAAQWSGANLVRIPHLQPAPVAEPVPTAQSMPVLDTAASSIREQFDAWVSHRREVALADALRHEALAIACKSDAELDIAARKRALGI